MDALFSAVRFPVTAIFAAIFVACLAPYLLLTLALGAIYLVLGLAFSPVVLVYHAFENDPAAFKGYLHRVTDVWAYWKEIWTWYAGRWSALLDWQRGR